MPASHYNAQILSNNLELPCGAVSKNRLVKAAMVEGLAKRRNGRPNQQIMELYRRWSEGGYGMVISGNIQVDQKHLGTPGDLYLREKDLHDPPTEAAWSSLATTIKKRKALAVGQLCHTGRQSVKPFSGRWPWEPSLSASSVPVRTGDGILSRVLDAVMFGTPKAMSMDDIKATRRQFVNCAEFLHRTGWDGVELHCSHGYLLSQFMSPKTNQRKDQYGGDRNGRMLLLLEIISEIRAVVPQSFTIGVKLNSSDYVTGGLTEEEALYQLTLLACTKQVDFVEISGGTYERAEMLQDVPSDRTNKREAFFLSFAHKAKNSLPKSSKMAIMCTGGFRSRKAMASAVQDDGIDLIGLGRPTCVDPELGLKLLDTELQDEAARCPEYTVKGTSLIKMLMPINVVGAGLGTMWHQFQIFRIAAKNDPAISMSFPRAALDAYTDGLLTLLMAISVICAMAAAWQN